MPSAEYVGLSPERAIAYFREKLALPSERWSDLWGSQHDRAFVVAGAMRRDLVADFQSALQDAIENGTTLQDFRRQFDEIVRRYGWDYNGTRGWRTRVIYETNLSHAYAAGELDAQLEIVGDRPYWMYRHGGSLQPREDHLSWDGLVLRADDPWWQTHRPPNGWGCSCYVDALDEDGMKAAGKRRPDQAPEIETFEWTDPATGEVRDVPKGISPGFEYMPGESWARSHTPGFLGEPIPAERVLPERTLFGPGKKELPEARPGQLLPELPDEEYQRVFLDRFDATPSAPAVFEDAAGDRILMSEWMFRQGRAWSELRESGAARALGLAADTIRDPDEIWMRMELTPAGRYIVRKSYLARWDTDEGTLFVVFDWGPNGWTIVAAEPSRSLLEAWRRGARVHRRQ